MANVQSTQVKITLPNELYLHLKSKAEKLGLNMAAYIKHLVINDVQDVALPTFKMSEEREKLALKALKDYTSGKTKVLKDVDDYLNSL
jgi:predicted DNA-binding protein